MLETVAAVLCLTLSVPDWLCGLSKFLVRTLLQGRKSIPFQLGHDGG